MKERKFIESPFEIEKVTTHGQFEGYASVFDDVDSVHDRVAKGAFEKSLEKHAKRNRLPPMLWQHNTTEPIGKWCEIYEDSHGLFVSGELFVDDIPRAKQAYKLMTERALSGLSIGFKTLQSHRDTKTGVRILTEIDLLEISLVTFPALDSARINTVKTVLQAGRLPDERCLEAFLRDAGFSRKQAKSFIASGYKAISLRDAGEIVNEECDVAILRQLSRQLFELANA